MLRSLGVPVKGQTSLCGYNQRMIISSNKVDSKSKKNHVSISSHKLRETSAARILNPIKVCTMVIQAKMLMKSVATEMMRNLSNTSHGVVQVDA